MRAAIAAALFAAICASGAEAAPTASGSGDVHQPAWIRKPNGDDFSRYYPERAQRAGVGGDVMLRCLVDAEGRLDACVVLAEDPPGYDFGASALLVSRLFKMRLTAADGLPTPGRHINIPIRYRVPGHHP